MKPLIPLLLCLVCLGVLTHHQAQKRAQRQAAIRAEAIAAYQELLPGYDARIRLFDTVLMPNARRILSEAQPLNNADLVRRCRRHLESLQQQRDMNARQVERLRREIAKLQAP